MKKAMMMAMVIVAVAATIPASANASARSVLVKPDRVKVLRCDSGTYNATSAEVTTRVKGKREWMLLGSIRHPNREGTLGTFTRQGGGHGLARLYSTPDGSRMVVSNFGDYRVRVRDACHER